MKIYKDKTANEAIVICNAEELFKLVNGMFFGAEHFRKLAGTETEDWKRELDFNIAIKYAEMHDELAIAYKELKEANETTEE